VTYSLQGYMRLCQGSADRVTIPPILLTVSEVAGAR
jgi:hypothetical protein